MKKSIFSLFLTIFCLLASSNADALIIQHQAPKPRSMNDIKIVSFADYAPFGYIEGENKFVKFEKFVTPYSSIIEKFGNDNKIEVKHNTWLTDYKKATRAVRAGEVDIIIGMYHNTKQYKGIDIIYPALIKNPITIFTLPHKIKDIKNLSDLKNLKGAINGKEHLSDYVKDKILPYNIKVAKDSNELFKMLFTNEVDYIMGSHYYTLIEAIKLGLKDKIGIAKQTIWPVPMFMGVSKLSRHRNYIATNLTRISESPEVQKNIQQNIVDSIYKFEKLYKGVVPPSYTVIK